MKYTKAIKQTLFPSGEFQKATSGYNLKRSPFTWNTICLAPFTNMYIGHHGYIRACCYIAVHVLGVWPHRSLIEIWNGSKANELREALSNYDLSKGCDTCHQQLMARNYDGLKASQFNHHKRNNNGFPYCIEFELDNKCNLACTMCNENFSSVIAHNKGLKTYKTPYNNEFLEQLKPFILHLQETKFYGGEPFMIKIYYEIWDLIYQINPSCSINIQTNATVMNKRVEQLLSRPNINFNVSIDSLEAETYESIRLGANFEETMSNLHRFIDYSKKNNTFMGVSACMMNNTAYEAPDFINFCNEQDIQIYFHTVVQPEHHCIQNMPKSEIQDLLNYLKQQNFTSKTALHKKNIKHYWDYVKQVQYWLETKDKDSNQAHLNPVKSWEELFNRIQKSCIDIYGEEIGMEKSELFKTKIEEMKAMNIIQNEADVFAQIQHEDLSSSVHKIVDLSVEELIGMYQSMNNQNV